ncbi:MAG: response regulator [Candidatus Omnitrophica bacterium]|nr:response regulator [Candidatus Omnitrophota bacterium]
MKILIADDETGVVELLKGRLERFGHTIDTAYDGDRAMRLIRDNAYDILILDFSMPDVTGLEMLQYAKKNKPGTRVVIMSGYAGMDGALAEAAGADHYLSKPIPLEEFEKLIQGYAKGKK